MILQYSSFYADSNMGFIFFIVILFAMSLMLAKFFEIKLFNAIIMFFVIIITFLYDYGILETQYLAIAYLVFAIMIYAQIKNKNGSEQINE